ncbi:MAG: glycosyltransferase family 1 protein [Prevotella sp.]|nr:glycosyltransferase family 1 protein [Prevotella sp.]
MRILLLGEYSNVHATLAKGLRELGHEVVVASNGDFWKNYPRDIDLSRELSWSGSIRFVVKLLRALPKMKGFDVVQLINPIFIELKANRLFSIYDYLRKNNKKVFLGAFGMDYYWVHECDTRKPLRYSDFNMGDENRTNADAEKERRDWIGTDKERLNKYIAEDCDGIITGLYEYWACYHPLFPKKTCFIPYPIQMSPTHTDFKASNPPRIFIGINKARSEYKGTDIMLKAANDVRRDYPGKMELVKAESVPFDEYEKLMNGSDAILDQLYSYTPSMNSLLAMSKGIVNIGGGEPENYEILHENELRPIVNVEPTYESVYTALVDFISQPSRIPELKRQSTEYISRHHDYLKVARQYLEFYTKAKNL